MPAKRAICVKGANVEKTKSKKTKGVAKIGDSTDAQSGNNGSPRAMIRLPMKKAILAKEPFMEKTKGKKARTVAKISGSSKSEGWTPLKLVLSTRDTIHVKKPVAQNTRDVSGPTAFGSGITGCSPPTKPSPSKRGKQVKETGPQKARGEQRRDHSSSSVPPPPKKPKHVNEPRNEKTSDVKTSPTKRLSKMDTVHTSTGIRNAVRKGRNIAASKTLRGGRASKGNLPEAGPLTGDRSDRRRS